MLGLFIRAIMTHLTPRGVSVLLAATLVGGCSGSPTSNLVTPKDAGADTSTARPDATMRVCGPGAQVSCACPGGTSGVQVCDANGQGYGTCTGCPSASLDGAMADAGRDAGRLEDAAGDSSRVALLDGGTGDATPLDSGLDALTVDADGGCVSGALACVGAQPEICTTSGAWKAVGAPCSGATPACLSGACVACDPAATRCVALDGGDGIETCNGAGTWEVAVGCGAATPICTADAGTATCACPAGASADGGCACPNPGDSFCGATCVDERTDPLNCGGCGSPCTGEGRSCQGGRCVAFTGCTDDSACVGEAGTGARCLNGACVAAANTCSDTTQCPLVGSVPENCVDGVCTPSCANAVPCPAGYACDPATEVCSGNPTPCGAANPGVTCAAGTTCVDEHCVPACGPPSTDGGADAGPTCSDGLVCIDGGCIPSQAPNFVCTVQGEQDNCAAGSICVHHTCYISCAVDAGSAGDTCAHAGNFDVCKPVETSSGVYDACASTTNLGNQCDPTQGQNCMSPAVCIDGYCR